MLNKIREEFGFSSIDDNNTASKLMNDEIKEILDDLKTYKDRYEYYLFNNLSFSDRDYKAKILLDYITNLQQENQELNDSITWWTNRFNAVQRDYENYKSRIEKAIEYLKDNACYTDKNEFVSDLRYDNCEELLNILYGE